MGTFDKGWQDLANAIVERAALDYEIALSGRTSLDRCKAKELEWFFTSGYYQLLTKVDGELIMQKIRRRVFSNGRKKRNCEI